MHFKTQKNFNNFMMHFWRKFFGFASFALFSLLLNSIYPKEDISKNKRNKQKRTHMGTKIRLNVMYIVLFKVDHDIWESLMSSITKYILQ